MLNWDEYGKEEVNTAAVVTATKPVIETPQAAEQQPTPAPVNTVAETKSENVSIEEGSRAKIAREAIQNLDVAAATSKFCMASLAIFALEPSSILTFSLFVSATVFTGAGVGCCSAA